MIDFKFLFFFRFSLPPFFFSSPLFSFPFLFCILYFFCVFLKKFFFIFSLLKRLLSFSLPWKKRKEKKENEEMNSRGWGVGGWRKRSRERKRKLQILVIVNVADLVWPNFSPDSHFSRYSCYATAIISKTFSSSSFLSLPDGFDFLAIFR